MKTLVIFDIDNTLTDTWKTLNTKQSRTLKYILNERRRVRNLDTFPTMAQYVKTYQSSEDHQVVFLSARNIYLWDPTISFLRKEGLNNVIINVFLVRKAQDKLAFIQLLRWFYTDKIIYYDDLAYNHEYGEVKKYESLIQSIKTLKLTYIGKDEIDQLNHIS